MQHEPGIGARSPRVAGAEIMPPKNTGMRPARSWPQAMMLRDNGTTAVADVQLRHGSAHSLLHHFCPARTVANFCRRVSEAKDAVPRGAGPVQVVCQIEHVPPGLVTLRMVTIEKACRGSGV